MLSKNQAHTTPLKQKEKIMNVGNVIALAIAILEAIKTYNEN